MTAHAHIVGGPGVVLWGLDGRERLRRQLRRAGMTVCEELPDGVPVVLLRSDFVYDDRIIRALAGADDVLLRVGSRAAAARVGPELAARALDGLVADSDDPLPGVHWQSPETLGSDYQSLLRKADPPYVLPVSEDRRPQLEARLFASSYKGVTDFVTKFLWPRPAARVTRWCVALGLRPNHVTAAGLALVVLAGLLFAEGHYGWGLAAGWLMTFLDTVDGKLARVTLTSSRAGHLLDHGIDLIHPPLWYLAWGLGLEAGAVAGVPVSVLLWAVVLGYVAGRVVEWLFKRRCGAFGIFTWRPVDSLFRLITARRNPNLVLLTVATLLGRPELGLLGVAGWTALTTLFLGLRLVVAWRRRSGGAVLRSWLEDPAREAARWPLARRLFAGQGKKGGPAVMGGAGG